MLVHAGIFILLYLSSCQCQSPDDIDALFTSIFGEPENTTRTSELTPVRRPCECVPFVQCDDYNNTIKESGEGLIDIRFGGCPDSLAVCCNKPIDASEVTQRPTPQRKEKCGKRNISGVGFRIVTANKEAQFGEFPWMIGILKKDTTDPSETPQYSCGGSLIHPQVVLTAAHCVAKYEPDNLVARAGEWDSQSINELLPYQERKVFKIINHPSFSPKALHNDISLLILSDPFEFAENVDVVCLPSETAIVNGSRCVASGWGKDKFGKYGVYQNILKRVTQPLIDRNTCLAELRKTRLGGRFQLHGSFICAGGKPGEDTCEGDGGSPLVCPVEGLKDIYQQMGMVSWGIGCGDKIPAVYVNVPYFRHWIDKQLEENNLSTNLYVNNL